jgi:deoxyribodipyrimidine photo-lyase
VNFKKQKSQLRNFGLHWFRRDLRVFGNEALEFNIKKSEGRTLGLFCFDSEFLKRSDFSTNRFAFFLKTLEALRHELRLLGGDLLVIDSKPQEFFKKMAGLSPSLVTWNRDYEPFARKRDEEISQILKLAQIPFSTYRDHLVFEPYEILKSEKTTDFYQIYSPYSKKWLQKLGTPDGQSRILSNKKAAAYYRKLQSGSPDKVMNLTWEKIAPQKDSLQDFIKINSKSVTVPVPDAGSLVAYRALKEFKSKLKKYSAQRNFPAVEGTSKLSIFLKNGSLTSSMVISELGLRNLNWNSKDPALTYLKEIIWREFYYSIIFHRPDVETKSFLPQYRHLEWSKSKAHFENWKNGTTGFPIVDAGMRELQTTGWMHNRVRMIVASFLTKDLQINWQWGENHFMHLLLDGDLAANNGGWQWAASTGCDPQPYFRIFNPWLQSKKFDPEGNYIRKFVPELAEIAASELHKPDGNRGPKYPKPLVDHAQQKPKTLNLYKLAP